MRIFSIDISGSRISSFLSTVLLIPSPLLSAGRGRFCVQNTTIVFKGSKKENKESKAKLSTFSVSGYKSGGAALTLVLPIKGQHVM